MKTIWTTVFLLLSGVAAAQPWPAKPVRLVVPLAPGSTADIVSRVVGTELAKSFGQPVVVENKTGAGGSIATAEVARAAPDGYTFIFASQGTLVFNQGLYASPGYDSLKDLSPLAFIGAVSNVMIVHPSNAARGPLDVVAEAKSKPNTLTFSSGGAGTSHHLSGVLFARMTETQLVHVPYKATPAGILAVMTGEVSMGFFNTPTVIGQIQSGKLKALGVTSLTRSKQLPDVPTLDAQGIKGYELNTWFGFVGPAKIPAPVVERLNREINAVLAKPEVVASLDKQGFDLAPASTPAAFGKIIADDMAKWIPLIKDGMPRPGYDYWVSYDGHGRLSDPRLNHDGKYVEHQGYITDVMNRLAVDFIDEQARSHGKQPFSLFFAHKAVHPDAEQAADGTLKISALGGYVLPARHENLYKGEHFPMRPNVLPPEEVLKQKPVWAECFRLKQSPRSREILTALQSGEQEEIRRRAAMMASVDEGVGMILERLEKHGLLDDTFIVFLGDNGFFFGEHALGPERRFAYEEGIRSPFVVRYPRRAKPGSRIRDLVICQDIAPTLLELAGARPGAQVQGRSLLPLLGGHRKAWRKSFLIEYWAENAMPWLVGMTYKAVRTDRHKLIHWVNRGEAGELDELYDLERDPYELRNVIRARPYSGVRAKLQRELARLVVAAAGIPA